MLCVVWGRYPYNLALREWLQKQSGDGGREDMIEACVRKIYDQCAPSSPTPTKSLYNSPRALLWNKYKTTHNIRARSAWLFIIWGCGVCMVIAV